VDTSGSSSADPRERDEATLRFYASEAPAYVASGPSGASRHLDGFLNVLPAGARILELGCGGGRDSEAMLARGFDVDPTNGTPEMAVQASARLGREVRLMRFDQLEATDAYDAVWAHASLLHVPRAALPSVLARVFRALKPEGVHFADFKAGGLEGRDTFGRYFNYLTTVEVRDAYRASGAWEILSVLEYLGGGYDGRQGPWVAITARRPA
jgi:SAM-dependent methyltransferase